MLAVIVVNVEQEYLKYRREIDRIAGVICRRSQVASADAEDFASTVHLHFIKDDYAVLRAYQGRAEFGAFLQAVIRRLFQDWRNANWGRWRPSEAAKRGGATAMLLEALIVRDGRSLDESIEMLRTNHGVSESVASLKAIAASFPDRAMRRFTSLDLLADMADRSGGERSSAAVLVDRAEHAALAARVSASLDEVLQALPPEDQVILRMRLENGLAISAISRMLGSEQMPVYRRINRLVATVRAALEQRGVTADDARRAAPLQ